MHTAERGPAGELALRIADQGWAGLLPLLPHDAVPNVRLAADKAAEVEAGRGKAPGRWARAGWSLLHDWRGYPDDAGHDRGVVAAGPASTSGCGPATAAPWVAFIDVDVLHHEAAAEIQAHAAPPARGPGRVHLAHRAGAQVPDPGAGHGAGHPLALHRGRDRRPAAHGRGAGRRASRPWSPASTRRPAGPMSGPRAGLEETEPGKLPLVTPAELAEILAACSKILLRYGHGCRAQGPIDPGRGQRPAQAAARAARPRSRHWPWPPPSSWSTATGAYDDWVAWAYALRGAFGDDGKPIWLRFSAQSVKATNPATAEKVWRDATQAERDGHLRAGAGTVIAVAKEEGWTPPPSPGLPAYFDGGEQDAAPGERRPTARRRSSGSSRVWPTPARARRRATPSPAPWAWARPPSRWRSWRRWPRA